MTFSELRLRPARLLRTAGATWSRTSLRLAAAVVTVQSPVALVSLALLVGGLGPGVVVVNTELELAESLGADGGAGLGDGRAVARAATALVLVLLGVSVTVAVAAASVVVAGRVVGAWVGTGDAVRQAVRRLPALAVLTLLWMSWFAVALAAGLAVVLVTAWWLGLVVFGLVLLPSLPYLVAVAVVAVEQRGWWSALRRVHALTAARRSDTIGILLAATAVLLGVAWVLSSSVRWLLDAARAPAGYGGIAVTLAADLVRWLSSVLVVSGYATILTFAYLNGRRDPLPGDVEADLSTVRGRLVAVVRPSAARAGRRRWYAAPLAVVSAGLLVPTLVYGALLAVNPRSWPAMSDHTVGETWSSDQVTMLVPATGGPPAVALGGFTTSLVVTCEDARCVRSRTGADPSGEPYPGLQGGAALAAGRDHFVLAGWLKDRSSDDDRDQLRLRLFTCGRSGCGGAGASLRTSHGSLVETAVTRAPDGRLLVASVAPGRVGDQLTLTLCPNAACASPHTVPLGEVRSEPTSEASRPLSVAADGSGKVVVAQADRDDGTLTVVTCPRLDCTQRRVSAHLVGEEEQLFLGPPQTQMRTDAAFVGGRPVVAYRTVAGRIGLLVCDRDDCASSHAVPLAAADVSQPGPALAVDRSGRPVVAFVEPGTRRLALVRCADPECRQTTRTGLLRAADEVGSIDVGLDPADRPLLAWVDGNVSRPLDGPDGGPVHVTVCADPACRPHTS